MMMLICVHYAENDGVKNRQLNSMTVQQQTLCMGSHMSWGR